MTRRDFHPDRVNTSLPRADSAQDLPPDMRRFQAIIAEHLGLAPNSVTGKQLVARGFLFYRNVVTGSSQITEANELVAVTAAGATLTLDTDLLLDGTWVRVFNEFAGAGTTTIATEGGALINGSATYTLNGEYASAMFYTDGTNWYSPAASAGVDHGALTGLGDDDHSQYALLAGRAGGQDLTGGTAAGEDLTLRTTSDGTKGSYILAELTTNGFLRTTNSDGTLAVSATIDISDDTNLAVSSPVTLTGDTIGLDQTAVDHGTIGGLSDDDHPHYLLTNGGRNLSANWDAGSFTITALRFVSDQATGTAPFTVSSTTLVSNLNSDLLDGEEGTYYLDSANFTGTNWTDLTDGGGTTLHTHDHGAITGLTDDDHTQYALLAGRSGGQTLIGGTDANDDLTLQTTSNATKGDYILSELTTNGFVKTTGGGGTLTVSSTVDISDDTNLAVTAPITLTGDTIGIDQSAVDHGSLGGLSDDDHTQYLLANGTRELTADWDAGAHEIRAETLVLDVAGGTAPMVVASTTLVASLNSDLLDGEHGTYYLDSANFTGTNWTDLTDAGATTLHKHDHGGMDGLGDDDHTIYLLADGTRQLTGTWTTGSQRIDGYEITVSNVLTIPVSSAPTVNADGEFAMDTTVTDFSHGIPKIYGGEELGVVVMPIAQFSSPTDGYAVAYNATNDEFELVEIAATPGGSSGDIQYNNSGAFGGFGDWNGTRMDVPGLIYQTSIGNSAYLGDGAGAADDLSDNRNVGVGFEALNDITTGFFNVGVGYRALTVSTTGNDNVAIGYQSLDACTTGFNNIGIGSNSLGGLTTARANIGIGVSAGVAITSGINNVIMGASTGSALSTGSNNVFIGQLAGTTFTAGSNLVAVGSEALRYATGSSNTALGSAALRGAAAGFSGLSNVGIGTNVGLAMTTSGNNVLIGEAVGQALTTGGTNTYVGAGSGFTNATGTGNVGIGYRAIRGASGSHTNNTAIGVSAGNAITTGSNNVFIGANAGDVVTTGGSNIIIGVNADPSGATVSNELNIGDLLYGLLSSNRIGINEQSPDYTLDVNGAIGFTPGSSVTPVDNGDVIFELTNNTTLTVRAKGSDGTVRSGTITLA